MNEDIITDLKQFIAATVAQQTTDLRQEIGGLRLHVKQELGRIDQKLDNLSAFVAQAIDAANDTTGTQLKNHEQRITQLEHYMQRTI